MIRELSRGQGNVLGFKITDKVSLEEEKKWIARIEKAIEKNKKVRILIVIGDEAHWSVKAGTEDLKWLTTHIKQIEKIAIVVDRKMWKWLVALDEPFAKILNIKEKQFQPSKIEDAWKWIEE